MDKKIVAVIAAVVLIAVVAIVAIGATDESEEGVVYDGNGGLTSDGNSRITASNHTVIPNLFEKEGLEFASWNTKADGSGTTYKPGDNIDYASGKTVTLYAQWQTPSHRLIGFSVQQVIDVTTTLNGSSIIPGMSVKDAGNVFVMKCDKDGCVWSLDNNVFKLRDDMNLYSATVTVDGGSNIEYRINADGLAEVTFSAGQDVSISLSIIKSK